MRTTAVVLGCIGEGLLVVLGIPLTVMHPYQLLVVIIGGLGIAGGIKARTRRVLPGVLLAVATTLTVLFGLASVGIGVIVLFVPSLLLLLAMIFAFAAPLPPPVTSYPPPPGYPPYSPLR